MSADSNAIEYSDSEEWKRFAATMEALTGIVPSRGDSGTAFQYRIWTIGYLAGLTEGERRMRR